MYRIHRICCVFSSALTAIITSMRHSIPSLKHFAQSYYIPKYNHSNGYKEAKLHTFLKCNVTDLAVVESYLPVQVGEERKIKGTLRDGTTVSYKELPCAEKTTQEGFGAGDLKGYIIDKVTYSYTKASAALTVTITAHEASKTSTATATGSTPLTPEELYQIQLDKDYPAGNAYVGPGKDACFVEAGNEGTSVNAWQAGKKTASFVVKDKDDAVVKATLLGQKKIGDKYYISISAYSKAGGLNIAISDADREALKAKGISGIVQDGKTVLMEF